VVHAVELHIPIGRLYVTSANTRPDITFAVGMVSRYLEAAVKQIFRWIWLLLLQAWWFRSSDADRLQ
jgi:hypothetical protein